MRRYSIYSILLKAVLQIRDVYPGSRIPDPDFYPSRIPDPKTATKERGEKKISCHTIFCCYKFHKIEHYLVFEILKEKIWANFQRIMNFLLKKLSLCSQKLGLGSGIRKKPIPNPRSRIQASKRHRILDPDPQHCLKAFK